MLFSTFVQPKIFWILFISGFFSGFLFDFSNLIAILCEKNKIIKNIFEFISSFFSLLIFFLVNLNINYGELRLFAILAFVFGLGIQRITIGNIIAKFYDLWYSLFNKMKNKLRKRSKKNAKEQSDNIN